VLVTAGPTYEPIDPVRFIGNHSSGKMGVALALELADRGAEVHLVIGPGVSAPTHQGIKVSPVITAAEMHQACVEHFPNQDLAIMAAAVADYTPETVAEEKIKKQDGGLQLSLAKTRDILKHLGQMKKPNQILVGFALETNNEKANALGKLESKNADLIILNSLKDEGAGFGVDTNKITIFDRFGKEESFPTKSKKEVAADIINTIHTKFYE
jgi:phosphopantothenoylcysteine decarboxylase/phosphopantothenate--cysteine ligase